MVKVQRAKKTKKATKGETVPVRDWTLIIYLCGDNNLSGAATVDLMEMKKIGSTDRVNVVAQLDRAGKRIQTTRYLLRKGTPLAKDALVKLGETDMGDPAVLNDFVTWSMQSFPARHYVLILWNHGAGWDDSNLYEGDAFEGKPPPVSRKGVKVSPGPTSSTRSLPLHQVRAAVSRTRRALFRTTVSTAATSRGIAFDDDAQDFLDNIELKNVLAKITKRLGRKLDILGMDACLMSMIEVSYQIRDAALFTVGSQEEEPGDGWPYDRILRNLTANPGMSAKELAATMVREYLASYPASEAVTQAAVDLGHVQALVDAIDTLGRELKAALKEPAGLGGMVAARAKVQEYTKPYDDYVDLVDLCNLLQGSVANPSIDAACTHVVNAVKAAVVAQGSKAKAVAHSNGVSVYFPKKMVSPLYGTLDFTKQSRWDEFLAAYLSSLQR